MTLQTLTGWGRCTWSRAHVAHPPDASRAAELVAGAKSVLGRGLGRAYGDAAQNAGGLVIATDLLQDRDAPGPVMNVAAGVSIDDLLRQIVPAGYFVPVTPGTRYVTIGGALASDIQGKNHHADGALSAHTDAIDLVLADGAQVTVGPDQDPDLFWATAGGMGLTGLITGARIRMRHIESSQLLVDTTRVQDLDELIAAMYEADSTHRYSVAWVDTLATGRTLGRSVLTVGDFATVQDLPVKKRPDPLAYAPAKPLTAPTTMPNVALNRWSVAAFNEMWFRKAPKRRLGELQSIPTFFHPLDGVAEWNRIYGSRGFLQYQVIVPDGHEDLLRSMLERFAAARCPVFLAVLKRFGPEGPSPITFALKGWTLALDIPTDVPGLGRLLDALDDQVAQAGGRIYLTKDSRMSPATFRAMYPKAKDFERVRDRVDPQRKFRSDLSERLGL
ncbi:MAG: FAD-binding oxidoreductase [Candidatus Nanopelagicales bacterium]